MGINFQTAAYRKMKIGGLVRDACPNKAHHWWDRNSQRGSSNHRFRTNEEDEILWAGEVPLLKHGVQRPPLRNTL